jgi:enoyl-CoA hydratase/carnithine racemase
MRPMTDRRVHTQIDDDGVLTVVLARADKHNALDLAMFHALREAIGIADDVAARCVVMYGEGPSFCSGLDFPSFTTNGRLEVSSLLGREDGQVANLAQHVAYGWTQVNVPVIAAITGACLGGGLQIALGADIRLATPDARLSLREIEYGLVPDMGISQTLPPLIGIDKAKELVFTGRTLTGAEAFSIGLVTRLADDPIQAATALAREIASKSTSAVRSAKSLLNYAWPASDTNAALILETSLQESLLQTMARLD